MHVNDTWLYMTDCRGMALHKLHRIKFESTWMDQLKKSTVRTPPWLDVWVSEFGIHRDQPQLLKWLPWWHRSTRTPIHQPQQLLFFEWKKIIWCKKSTPIKPIPSQTKINTIKPPSICKCFPSPKKSPQLHRCIAPRFSPSHSCQVEVLLVEWIRLHYILGISQKQVGFEKSHSNEHEVVNLTRSQWMFMI